MSKFKIFVVLYLSFYLTQSKNQDHRVLLEDVKELTLYKGRQTQTRRVSFISQIKCIAGSAKYAYEPNIIQCYNQGSDGIDIQWNCTSQIPKKYQFEQLNVYNSLEDPYILVGSCGLEYNLELIDKTSYDSKLTDNQQIRLSALVFLVFIVIIILIIFVCKPVKNADYVVYAEICRECRNCFLLYSSNGTDSHISNIRLLQNVREVYRKYPSYGYIVRQSASFDNDSYTRIRYGETKRR